MPQDCNAKHLLSISAFACISCFTACTVTQEIFLQDAEISGPFNQPPLHVTNNLEPNTITVSPRIGFGTSTRLDARVDGHSKVNSQGFFQVDTLQNGDSIRYFRETAGVNNQSYRGKNLHWNIPAVTVGLEFDFVVSRSFGLIGGIDYASSGDKSVWGGHAGLSLRGEGESSALRFEGGIHWQSLSGTISSLVITTASSPFGSGTPYIMFYEDDIQSSHVNPFASLTINSKRDDWPVNIALQLGISRQTLFDFSPKNTSVPGFFYVLTTVDNRGEKTATIFTATSVICFDVSPMSRVVAGVRVLKHDFEDAGNPVLLIPMMQVDFRF
jgi:hypothetical protein